MRRLGKRRIATLLGRYVFNPPVRALFWLGFPLPGTAILETVGRNTGATRRTPVTNGLDGETFWIVAEHGRRAGYVRNIEANPQVRVRLGRRWIAGTAQLAPEEDPKRRLAAIARRRRSARLNARMVVSMSTEPVVVCVHLP